MNNGYQQPHPIPLAAIDQFIIGKPNPTTDALQPHPAAAQQNNEEDSSSSEEEYYPYDERVLDALELLSAVYDQPNSPNFPLPLETYEAGPCLNGQRRYLWTDAFGVMAYQSLAEYYMAKEDVANANLYRGLVEKLIAAVHESLGRPRSNGKTQVMKECAVSPTGYAGLRIGKPTAKTPTDPKTRYDGQFWHHIDKWLFALVRANHISDGVRIAKSCFPYFFRGPLISYGMVEDRGGMRAKISVNTKPPSFDPNKDFCIPDDCYDDTLNALVVFSMLEAKNQNENEMSLQPEIDKLRGVLRGWKNPSLNGDRDPIVWGMETIFDQFVVGHPRTSTFHFREHGPHHVSVQQYCGRPWLAYGALMGAIADGNVLSEEDVQYLLGEWNRRQDRRYYFHDGHKQEADRKAGMMRVMLAMALLSPGVLKRRVDDVMVQI